MVEFGYFFAASLIAMVIAVHLSRVLRMHSYRPSGKVTSGCTVVAE
jgi:hypothetical protein